MVLYTHDIQHSIADGYAKVVFNKEYKGRPGYWGTVTLYDGWVQLEDENKMVPIDHIDYISADEDKDGE